MNNSHKKSKKDENKLYPIIRQAKKDKNRTKLVRDILYIEGEVYTPPTESAPAQSNNGQH